jgi:hypothetical protein
MKKLILLTTLILGGFLSQSTDAQVSIKVNISSQPIWGPVGYDHVDYYYIPDIEAYYYVPKHRFIYFQGNRWIFSSTLPPRYHNFDLYRVDKVVINEPQPYLHHNEYKMKYAAYRGHHNQQDIRDSHDERYFEIKDHPEHNRWKEVKQKEKQEKKEKKFKEHDRGHGRNDR